MKNTLKYLLIGCYILFYNCGFSQCYCDDVKVIELRDTTISGPTAYFTFKLTSDSSNCNSGYSDFWFIDQVGDTINQWTGSGMWLPAPSDPMFDTTVYIIALKPGYSNFPASFSGNLQVWNPDCTIPLNYSTLTTNEIIDLEPDIQLFPNPTHDAIKVLNTSDFRITSLKVYGSDGKFISLEYTTTDFITVNTLVPGIYFVKLYSDERVIATKKLIKN